ncbi:hypothetical protein PtB15_7B617 [Puccinia triticina]|nr:hypothetical protein PtB15_7B617 [Puccinia triticina]
MHARLSLEGYQLPSYGCTTTVLSAKTMAKVVAKQYLKNQPQNQEGKAEEEEGH